MNNTKKEMSIKEAIAIREYLAEKLSRIRADSVGCCDLVLIPITRENSIEGLKKDLLYLKESILQENCLLNKRTDELSFVFDACDELGINASHVIDSIAIKNRPLWHKNPFDKDYNKQSSDSSA